jgi:AcrR family transcriptional regulator
MMEKNYPDTKSKIINVALRMFATEGYDKVSIRDIAEAVSIKSGSLYHHFDSKEQILQECYHFYAEHRHDTRLNKEQYIPIIKNGAKKEVIQALNYSYPDDIIENMVLALLIMFARMYIDEEAKNLYADEINRSMQYMEEFFTTGIEIGRFHQFNIPTVSLIYLSSRLFTGQSVALRPEQKDAWREAEIEIFDELIKIIPFKY